MPDNNIFSGIPALDDNAGLEQFVNNTTLTDMGLANPTVPPALQINSAAAGQTDPAQDPIETPANPNPTPQYTSEQISQIIARNQQLEEQAQASQRQVQQSQIRQNQAVYTPQQINIMKQLLDRGVSLERIQQALNGNRQQPQNNATMQRLQNIEQYLQNQQYLAEQNAFVEKMTTFGDKFGLSEQDLVTFGNKAYSMGINLTTVNDVEAVFRAVYPEQYAIRSQRITGAPTSQIYGGASTPEAPRATTSKLEDAYVDNFLKQAMPNQYSMFPNKH